MITKSAISSGHLELGVPFYELMRGLLSSLIDIRSLENDEIQAHVAVANHFLDFLRLCLQPPDLGNANEYRGTLSIPTITELYRARVKYTVV